MLNFTDIETAPQTPDLVRVVNLRKHFWSERILASSQSRHINRQSRGWCSPTIRRVVWLAARWPEIQVGRLIPFVGSLRSGDLDGRT
jgi:hypothetical protein